MATGEKTPGRRPAVDLEDVAELLHNADEPVLGTSTVGERLGVSRVTAAKYLKELKEKGIVDKVEVGNAPAWYIVERENARIEDFLGEEGLPDPPRPEGDGGGETEVPREVLTKIRLEVDEVVTDALERYEQKRTREASEETLDTWGARAKAEASVGFGVASKFGLAVVVLTAAFLALENTVPGLLGFGVTGAGSVRDWILMGDIVVFVLALWGVAYGVAFRVIAWFGIADWAEKRYRSLYHSIFQE